MIDAVELEGIESGRWVQINDFRVCNEGYHKISIAFCNMIIEKVKVNLQDPAYCQK